MQTEWQVGVLTLSSTFVGALIGILTDQEPLAMGISLIIGGALDSWLWNRNQEGL